MAEYCDNPTGMRPVKECEYGGLEAKDKIAGPQATGAVASGKFGGSAGKDPAALGKRYPVGSNVGTRPSGTPRRAPRLIGNR